MSLDPKHFLRWFGPAVPGDGPVPLPPPLQIGRENPRSYLADPDLETAAKVAILLGKPLLLTGEPGSGKTQFAYYLSWQLGLGSPLVFETKSTSVGRDLFYAYNTLARFHGAQTGTGSTREADYITYHALGEAILRTRDMNTVADLVPNLVSWQPARSVVLIDEVDKAPRDFPNDILNEIERMRFRIAELRNVEVAADPNMPPIVILTSNSEKSLPDPFLRRCVFYHIPFPESKLAEIVESRLSDVDAGVGRSSELVKEAVNLFLEIRKLELEKKPATAELLDWIQTLRAFGAEPEQGLKDRGVELKAALPTLLKTENDLARAARYIDAWLKPR